MTLRVLLLFSGRPSTRKRSKTEDNTHMVNTTPPPSVLRQVHQRCLRNEDFFIVIWTVLEGLVRVQQCIWKRPVLGLALI